MRALSILVLAALAVAAAGQTTPISVGNITLNVDLTQSELETYACQRCCMQGWGA